MQSIANLDIERITNTFNKKYFFGSVYIDYDEFYNWKKFAADLMNRHPFNSFLDIGCGCGNLVKEIKLIVGQESPANHNIQGIDASTYAVSRANVPFVRHADCRQLPFADSQFDLVYILTTFSYLPRLSDIQQAMREAHRVASYRIIFDDVYSPPRRNSYAYDPQRQIVYSQEQWLAHWQAVLGPEDSAEMCSGEIIINKKEHGA